MRRSVRRRASITGSSSWPVRLAAGKTAALQAVAEEARLPLVNVNLELSKRMLELTRTQRSRQVERLLKEVIAAAPGDVVLLDNLEILFDPAWRSSRFVCSRCRAGIEPSSPRGTAPSRTAR